jgi:hypothetical protein
MATEVPPHDQQSKTKPGASWQGNEQQLLPKNRIIIVFLGLMACIFLAAIDQVV